jgi:DNA polymerase
MIQIIVSTFMSHSENYYDPGAHFLSILTQVREYLNIYQGLGLDGFVCCFAPGHRHPHARTLESIWEDLKGCQRCKLFTGRTHSVFGEGNSHADLVFVGEGPGYHEDQQGRPFVGRAGELLTRIIAAIGLRREEVYITNIVKCRPPNNRNPEPDEILMCEPFLLRQLEVIQPKIICALGKVAAQTLLNSDLPISKLRGRFHDYHGIKLMPTYHPAYLLRNPGGKRLVWEDMQLVQKAYEAAVGQKLKT